MQKSSLIKEFIVFVSIITALVVVLTGLYTWNTYNTESKQTIAQLENVSTRTERALTQSLQYSRYILEYVLSQLNGKWEDLPYINKLLHTLRVDTEANTLLSWNMFSWSNMYHKVVVNSLYGVLDKPIDVSHMTNMGVTMVEPGIMHLGKPTYGAVSGQWVIPAAIGAVDENGRYMGAIGMGLSIDGILAKLDYLVANSNINYAILDSSLRAIVRSTHEKTSQSPTILALLQQHLATQENNKLLSYYVPWKKGSDYVYFQRVADSPYILLFSYDATTAHDQMWQKISSQIQQFIIISAVILILLILLYYRLIGPITQLSVAADKISHGEHNVPIPISGHYEIANLAEKLKQVANYIEEIERVKNELYVQSSALSSAKTALESAHTEVKQINDSLEQRVAERTESLQEALVAKQEFLNNISHEIRTPVSCVQMRSGVLVDMWEELNEEERKDSALDIRENCSRLWTLLSNLLDMAACKSGKLTYQLKRHNLHKIAQTVIAECAPLFESKELQVALLTNTGSTMALLDAMRMEQVIRNLLANAIRFTAKGTITLRLYNEDIHYEDGRKVKGLALSVTDEGVGIPEKELFIIFEAFTQSSKTRTGAGGTGLGLAICREIIRAHQGTIRAENNPTGKGASFTFVIPVKGE